MKRIQQKARIWHKGTMTRKEAYISVGDDLDYVSLGFGLDSPRDTEIRISEGACSLLSDAARASAIVRRRSGNA